jgi:hypothetical protein
VLYARSAPTAARPRRARGHGLAPALTSPRAIHYGMPLVLEIRCSGCGYCRQSVDQVLLVAMSDGVDEVCMHPGEARHATRLTGLQLSELRRQGRLHAGCPAFCTRCGDVGYHRRPAASAGSGASWAQALACHSCGAQGLQALRLPSGDPPGGVVTAGLLVIATMWPPLLLSEPWVAFPGAVLLASFVLWWRRRAQRARTQQAQVPCPQCGRPGISVRSIGIS